MIYLKSYAKTMVFGLRQDLAILENCLKDNAKINGAGHRQDPRHLEAKAQRRSRPTPRPGPRLRLRLMRPGKEAKPRPMRPRPRPGPMRLRPGRNGESTLGETSTPISRSPARLQGSDNEVDQAQDIENMTRTHRS